MQIRKALPNELDLVYRMGFDTWGGGIALDWYLREFRTLSKYGRGGWWVLDDGNVIKSSLITYEIIDKGVGMGSISTHSNFRNQG